MKNMKCLNCHKQTPDTELYCRHCGVKLDYTFDEVKEKFTEEIKEERADETEAFFRWIMLIFILVYFSGFLFNKLWQNSPSPSLLPGYHPSVKIQDDSSELYKPLVLPE